MMKFILFNIIIFLGCFAFGQTYPDEQALENEWEQWQDKVPVSGSVSVGLMLDQANDAFDPSSFYIVIPDTETTNICVELSSKDGRYSANINYDISDLESGIQQFILPTKYKSELAAYSADEVVILATLSASCDGKPDTYLVSGWLQMSSLKRISVYVNSIVPTTLVVVNNDESAVSFSCETLELPKVAYNKKCTIPLEVYNTATSLVIKERVRRGIRVNFNESEMPVKPVEF